MASSMYGKKKPKPSILAVPLKKRQARTNASSSRKMYGKPLPGAQQQ